MPVPLQGARQTVVPRILNSMENGPGQKGTLVGLDGLENRLHFLNQNPDALFVPPVGRLFHLQSDKGDLGDIERHRISFNLVANFLGVGVVIIFQSASEALNVLHATA